ncbi:MMPL family transporter [Luteipulveratus flavus]|uniref:MMPL family transporter n=1 Tax=Luteipulveratus flavus TaxID=3031728 RepID=A0ABT6C1Y1_9MICO|nr:MMPL family transporter [Luteipulveratus sp. YIM 133296]MDF8262792.1 MMPL family transporter [Luteipulveratus sp. YIM 133296]
MADREVTQDGSSVAVDTTPRRDPHGLFSPAARALGRLVGRRAKWVTVVLAVVVAAAALALGGSAEATSTTATSLPASAEAARADVLRNQIPSGGNAPAIAVFSRPGALTAADRAAVTAAQRRVVAGDRSRQGPPPQYARDGSTGLLVIPLSADLTDDQTSTTVEQLRTTLRGDLPAGLQVNVTGGPAFSADVGKIFEGADVRLLLATAGVVALLLLLTYRSPWLWLVPLIVVAVGDQVASKAVAALSRVTDLRADGAVTGITSVLVFGAGTNYALLIIARYREELRRTQDRHEAMRAALRSASPAVLASSSTVILALLSLGLADDPFTQSLGYASAVGIAIALAFALLVLPAAMVLFGRRLFWPFVPRLGQAEPTHHGFWSRVGERVTRNPVKVGLASAAVLAVLACGGFGLRIGLTSTEQFLQKPEAVVGQEQLARAFPAGTSEPTVVLTRSDQVAAVTAAVQKVDGVASVRPAGSGGGITELDAVLSADPNSSRAFDIVRDVRTAASSVPGARALVGGADAEALDAQTTAARDYRVLTPVILAIVLAVLLLLLRSVVAAVLLVLTVMATYVASMGASWFAFDHWLDFPAMALSTPLLAFLFLVALGVDYNIFLTTRAREEASEGAAARPAIVRALAVTGGVITSAGILLASVFAVLGVLPLIQLAQVGTIVGFGVLLDTLLVRSVVVPALVSIIGERWWWPSHPGPHGTSEPEPAP